MKKLLLLGALISSVAMAEGNVAEARIGANFGSTTFHYGYYIDDLSNKVKSGFELAGEYRTDLGSGFQVGGGIAYRYNKLPKFEGYESQGLHSFPIYATARYTFHTGSELVTYVKANLGYSFNSGSIKNTWDDRDSFGGRRWGKDEIKFGSGFYYGVGTGIQYKNFVVDLSWSNTLVKTKWEYDSNYSSGTNINYSGSKNLNHDVVTLSVGYSFGF